MMLTIFVLLCVLVVAFSETLLTKSYYNSEESPNSYGNVEYHCISTLGDGRPYYVRGTYGRRGYFEGEINNHVANVNFWEITLGGSVLVPSTGAAILTYSSDYSTVQGSFWNAGESDIFDSVGAWGIESVCEDCFNGVSTMEACFYDASSTLNDEAAEFIGRGKANNMVFGEDPSVFNHVGLGSAQTGGQLMGAYGYTYSEAECTELDIPCGTKGRYELGHYGLNGISANGRSLSIMATTWTAVSGPYEGSYGSALYALVPVTVTKHVKGEGQVEMSELALIGHFCYADSNADFEGIQITDCSIESSAFIEQSKPAAQKLLAAYDTLTFPAAKGSVKLLQNFCEAVFPRGSSFLKDLFENRAAPFLEYFFSSSN